LAVLPARRAALTASSAASLQAEYQSVIDRYHVTRSISTSKAQRAKSAFDHAARSRSRRTSSRQSDLTISFTLPVLPTGLTADGFKHPCERQARRSQDRRGQHHAMDYGPSVDNGGQMGLDAIQAAIATEAQISSLGLSSQNWNLRDDRRQRCRIRGVHTRRCASTGRLRSERPNVVRLSMWSVARDNGNTAGVHYASPDSSGIAQHPYDFSAIFHQFDLMV